MFWKRRQLLTRGVCVCGVAEQLHDLVPKHKCPGYCERATMDAHELEPEHDCILAREVMAWDKSRKWYQRLWDRLTGSVYCFWCQQGSSSSLVTWNPINPRGPHLYATLTCKTCGHAIGPIETQFLVEAYRHLVGIKGGYRAIMVKQRFEEMAGIKPRH